MSLKTSIPHLHRAIAEKRASNVWLHDCTKRHFFESRHQSSSSSQIAFKPPTRPPATTAQPEKNWPAQITNVSDPREARRVSIYFKVSAGFAFVVGLYCTYLYVNWTNSVTSHAHSGNYLPFNADVSNRWKDLSRDFDDEVELSEKLLLMKKKRRRLVQYAYGNVLEVSVGTGRNLDYYDLQGFDPTKPSRRNIISHLTLNDQSGVIIAAAEKKLEKLISRQEKTTPAKVDFIVGDAGITGVIERPVGGYDTIVQTMGVCSMVDAVGFLRKMGQLCRQPGEMSQISERMRAKDDDGKGGQILLLEHGRSYFDWLNWILDTGASLHAHRFGCWWNKDIKEIIEQSGLEIEVMKRFHGGTTWMIILRPTSKKETVKNSVPAGDSQVMIR